MILTPVHAAEGGRDDVVTTERKRRRGVTDLDQVFLDGRHDRATSARVADALVARGPERAGELLDLLASGSIQVRVGTRGRTPKPLLSIERQAIHRAFDTFPPAVTRDLLDGRLQAEPSTEVRVAAIGLLAANGDALTLERVLEWAQTEGHERRVARTVRAAFPAAICRLLESDPAVIDRLHGIALEANHSLIPGLIAALAEETSPPRLFALSELLGAVPEADPHILAEVAEMTRKARFVPAPRVAESVRFYLASPSNVERMEAIGIVETVADADSIPFLLDLVGEGDEVVRRRACAALRSISGQQLPAIAESWREWYAEVRGLWDKQIPEWITRARYGPRGVAARAIQELALLRTYRNELVAPLALVLQREEKELVVLTAASLGHLGSLDAIPHLLGLLESPDLDVRRTAYRALRRMTSEDHGDDRLQWERAGWGVPVE